MGFDVRKCISNLPEMHRHAAYKIPSIIAAINISAFSSLPGEIISYILEAVKKHDVADKK
jgi:hypothetical protein